MRNAECGVRNKATIHAASFSAALAVSQQTSMDTLTMISNPQSAIRNPQRQ
jgi:hypothetical protein